MPALPTLVHALLPRQTHTFGDRPPFASAFDDPDDPADLPDADDTPPFFEDHDGGHGLSAGAIAAIVVSILVFFTLITGLFAYRDYRKRKAAREEIAMKETASVTAVTAAGALDPPPPYEEVGHHDSHGGSTSSGSLGAGSQSSRHSRRSSDVSDLEDEEGSHPTITDGMEPGRDRS